jgi:hypothetical protein
VGFGRGGFCFLFTSDILFGTLGNRHGTAPNTPHQNLSLNMILDDGFNESILFSPLLWPFLLINYLDIKI